MDHTLVTFTRSAILSEYTFRFKIFFPIFGRMLEKTEVWRSILISSNWVTARTGKYFRHPEP